MHLVVPTHLSLFWVECHPNRTFLLKALEWELQNRLLPSPHCQTIPSFTSNPWPTPPVLAGYKWVVPEPSAYSNSMFVHGLSVVHALPWPEGLSVVHALPWPRGLSDLRYTFCYSFLTFCGLDESLDFHSLYIASSLGWVLLGHGHFLLQSNPYLLCGLADTFAMSLHCFCHVIIWLVLAGPFLGLLYTFLLFSSSSSVLSLGLYCFGLSWPISSIWGFLGPFYSFRHP